MDAYYNDMSQHTLFISDLHLSEKTPEITAHFLALLQSAKHSASALYILGDLFDAWIGDDDQTPYHQSIFQALRETTDAGLPIFVMRGNRDLLLGKRFAKECGVTLLEDPTVITLNSHRVLLTHGDTLCTDDHAHLAFRKGAEKKHYQWLFLHCPLSFRRWIVKKIRQRSTQRNSRLDTFIMDVTDKGVSNCLQKNNCYYLIHGHTHRPAEHTINLNGKTAHRYVLSAWDNNAPKDRSIEALASVVLI